MADWKFSGWKTLSIRQLANSNLAEPNGETLNLKSNSHHKTTNSVEMGDERR